MIVAVVAKEVEDEAQRRTAPDTVTTEEEQKTQYVILVKEDKARCMIWAKEEEKSRAQVSGRARLGRLE